MPTNRLRILIVDDDPIVAESLAEFLAREGYGTATAGDGNEALAMLSGHGPGETGAYGLVIADINMPRLDGMELLKRIRKQHESVAVIMVTGFAKIQTAVEAVRLGASEYLTKPVVEDELRIAVSKAVRQHMLLAENQSLKSQLVERFGMDNVVGADYRMQKVYDLIEAVAESKTTVLIGGESGTGKTMIARVIHTRSPRHAGPFTTFSCGAIPETLLESELFGHVRGAFTGADTDKPGKLQAAQGGTLFIDEIGSATPALQLKLLRVLQEKQFEPVGSTKTQSADVRFILATNDPLQDLVARGQFREDLYYRINVVHIAIPPLRDRVGDVPLLAEHFLKKYTRELNRTRALSPEALECLRRHRWQGNVRELENAIERAVVLSRQITIGADDLPEAVHQAPGAPGLPGGSAGLKPAGPNGHTGHIPALVNGWTPMPLTEALLGPERQILLAALEANNWNRQATASQLGINRTTLYKKIKQFTLDEPR